MESATSSSLHFALSPSSISSFDNMASSSEPQAFLKLEDLHSSMSPSTSYDDDDRSSAGLQESPAPVIVQSRPAKKRKSWGQELPEPKTNLPPRKRAKTDDEKEQRRIERIKRNRAAAHNSRERKRQETETLAVALARANAELDAYRKLHGPLPASVVLPEVTLSTDSAATPVPSLVESRSSMDNTNPPSPVDNLFDVEVNIKEEPSEPLYQCPITPPYETMDVKSSPLTPFDPTQHSAEMLCDLQCRSNRGNSNNNNTTTIPNFPVSWWSNLFLYVMTTQLQISYRAIMLAIWSHSPSQMARLMRASMRRSTSPSTISLTTPRPSRTNMALAQRNVATAMNARQGALALQRMSWAKARPMRSMENEQQQQQQQRQRQRQQQACQEQNSITDDEAFIKQDTEKGYGNVGMSRSFRSSRKKSPR